MVRHRREEQHLVPFVTPLTQDEIPNAMGGWVRPSIAPDCTVYRCWRLPDNLHELPGARGTRRCRCSPPPVAVPK
eukprot:9671919-Heterocapsa_arctica.AAC.1